MNFAFTSACCPQWDYRTLADRAAEYGYDGVEIHGSLSENAPSAANILLADPQKVADVFAARQVRICCLASAGTTRQDDRAAEQVRLLIDTAAQISCPTVLVPDAVPPRGRDRAAAAIALARWLGPLADYAAGHQVTLVVENSLSLRRAREMWLLMETLHHPAAGVCWDVLHAAMVGEAPAVSVPTLNSRIRHVHVSDARLDASGPSPAALGKGQVPVADLLRRLLGIGYRGWVVADWHNAAPAEILAGAIATLRQWTRPPTDAASAAKKTKAHATG